MTDIEKRVQIKKLQQEIDKRCAFFRILTDAGIKKSATPDDKPDCHPEPAEGHNSKLSTLN